MKNQNLSSAEYLDLFTRKDGQTPEYVLLPHEEEAVQTAYQKQVDAYKKIIDEKISVTGGDDWHDGAFRATDNEAKIVVANTATIAPFLGAIVVSYPDSQETRVALGSRAFLSQNGFSFPVDVVGFRKTYPDGVIDPETGEEVTGVSPESPLGSAILGKEVGDELSYQNGERRMNVIINRINQAAVKAYFFDNTGSGTTDITEA